FKPLRWTRSPRLPVDAVDGLRLAQVQAELRPAGPAGGPLRPRIPVECQGGQLPGHVGPHRPAARIEPGGGVPAAGPGAPGHRRRPAGRKERGQQPQPCCTSRRSRQHLPLSPSCRWLFLALPFCSSQSFLFAGSPQQGRAEAPALLARNRRRQRGIESMRVFTRKRRDGKALQESPAGGDMSRMRFEPVKSNPKAALWSMMGLVILLALVLVGVIVYSAWGGATLSYALTESGVEIVYGPSHVHIPREEITGVQVYERLSGGRRLFGTALPRLRQGLWSFNETGRITLYASTTDGMVVIETAGGRWGI